MTIILSARADPVPGSARHHHVGLGQISLSDGHRFKDDRWRMLESESIQEEANHVSSCSYEQCTYAGDGWDEYYVFTLIGLLL